MIIPCSHRFSNVVARGQHLRLALRSRTCESCAPSGKNYATINQKTRAHWQDFRHCDQTHPWQGKTLSPLATTLPTPSQDPSVSFCVSTELAWRTSSIACHGKNINDFAPTISNRLDNHSSPLLLPIAPRIDANVR